MMERSARTVTPLRVAIIVLTLGTALTHLTLNFPDPIFILNGLGYLTLLGALVLPFPALDPYRRSARWLLIGFTALTIVLWLVIGQRSTIGYVNKLNEVLLLLCLFIEESRSRRSRASDVL